MTKGQYYEIKSYNYKILSHNYDIKSHDYDKNLRMTKNYETLIIMIIKSQKVEIMR